MSTITLVFSEYIYIYILIVISFNLCGLLIMMIYLGNDNMMWSNWFMIHREIERFQLSFGVSIPCHHNIHIIQFYRNLLLCLKSVNSWSLLCMYYCDSVHDMTFDAYINFITGRKWQTISPVDWIFYLYFLSQQISVWFIFLVTNIMMYVLQYIPRIVHHMIPVVPV